MTLTRNSVDADTLVMSEEVTPPNGSDAMKPAAETIERRREKIAFRLWLALVIACPVLILGLFYALARSGDIEYPGETVGILHAGILILICVIITGFTSVLFPVWIVAALGEPVNLDTPRGRRRVRQLWIVLVIFSSSALLWGSITAFLIAQIGS